MLVLFPNYRKKSSFLRKFLLAILGSIVIATVAAVVAIIFISQDLPNLDKINVRARSQTSRMYSADGQLIATFSQENRTYVPLKSVTPLTKKAIICTEDKRFFTHRGLDPLSIIRALIADIRSKEFKQGGSTITQQYVKNAYFSPKRDLIRKIREAIMAVELEVKFSKEKILEKYLNAIYFGAGAYGIEAASETFFSKHCSKLTLAESALLAATLKSPLRFSPIYHPKQALQRRNSILNRMKKIGWAKPASVKKAISEPIALTLHKRKGQSFPYFAEFVKKTIIEKYGDDYLYRGGLRIITTLDTRVQRVAESAVKSNLALSSDPSAAVIVLDPRNGKIKAIVGGKDFSYQKFNVAVQGRRQPGSAFKPFVFAAALLHGISPDQTFNGDSPRTIPMPYQDWTVRNFANSSFGEISLIDATAHSVNTVFADLVHRIGADKVVAAASQLGITTPLDCRPSIALGGLRLGVSPLEMARAYSAFATGGMRADPTPISEIKLHDGETLEAFSTLKVRAIDPAVAYFVNEALERVIEEGTGAAAGLGRPAAAKTGTTQNTTDAWFVGYTPDLLTVVWVGYPQGKISMGDVHGVSVRGSTIPAYIWRVIMLNSLEGRPAKDFPHPPRGSIVRIPICDTTLLSATKFCPQRKLRFAANYRPSGRCTVHYGVIVTDVRLMNPLQAVKILSRQSLHANIVGGCDEKDEVVTQSPRPGVEVVAGSTIRLETRRTDLTKDGQAKVPNLIGLTGKEASQVLREYGLELSLGRQEGVITDQTPKPGELIEPGGTIQIESRPQSASGGSIVMPYLVGLSRKAALMVAKQNSLKPQIRVLATLGYPPDVVLGQVPTSGITIEPGAKIVIQLSGNKNKLH